MLCFNGKQKAACEIAYIHDTGNESLIIIILRFKIAVTVRDQPPYKRKS